MQPRKEKEESMELRVLYNDIDPVPQEIKNVVNIECFGDLLFKKTKLYEFTIEIFREAGVKDVVRVQDINDYNRYKKRLISDEDICRYLYMDSNIGILDRESFIRFLNKVTCVNNPLVVRSTHDNELLSLFVINREEMVDIIDIVSMENHRKTMLIIEKIRRYERLSNEPYLIDISKYQNFIKFIHSSMELRYFNVIEDDKYVISKKSEIKDKIKKEYLFYSFLPDNMKLYFVRPFEYFEEENCSGYRLEKLNIANVAIQWIHNSFDVNDFSEMLEYLFHFISIRENRLIDYEIYEKGRQALYVNKVDERIRSFKLDKNFKRIEALISMHTSYQSCDAIIKEYKKLFAGITNKIKGPYCHAVSHGDLCFSNILYDKKTGMLKLIDPRGALSKDNMFIDIYYDIAKLSHSILGDYDFINSGMFEIKFDENLQLYLDIDKPRIIDDLKKVFISYLKKNQYSYEMVRLYEISLFISMIPLHSDNPKKVLAFILNAIQFIEDLKK